MRIVFAGTPAFAVPALDALLGSGHAVVGVLTRPDRAQGRGLEVASSPVKRRALEAALPVDQPESLRTAKGRERLESWRPELLLVVAYGLLLPPEVLALPRLGCLNIHASLLPRWRGAAPIQRALLAGDAVTGISYMLMEAGLDTGPVLETLPLAIGERDTNVTLHERLALLGAGQLVATIDGLGAGRLFPVPQPAEGACYAARITRADALLDWQRPAAELDRQVRALVPWPVAETRLDGEPLRIHEAVRLAADPPDGAPPGTITRIDADGVHVRCAAGSLCLQIVQRPGRRAGNAVAQAQGGQWLGKQLGT